MARGDRSAAVLALESLLAARPEAWVGALDDGARYVPVPAAVPIIGHRLLSGLWPLELFAAGSRVRLADMWRARRTLGVASTEAELRTGGMATVHVFDVVDELGAGIIVVIGDPASVAAAVESPPDRTPSRFCRLLRDANGQTIEIDDAATSVLGYTAEQILGPSAPIERVHPEDHAILLDAWIATITEPGDGHRCRLRILRGDGTYRWFELTNFNRLDDPVRPHVVTEMLDIADEMAAHEAVAAREQLLHRLAEALPLGVLQVDPEANVVYRNDTLDAILGADRAATMAEQFASVVPEDRRLLDKAFSVALRDGSDDDVIVRVAGVRETEQLIRVITKSLHAPNGEVSGVIACVSDVTEATLMGRELERRATFDALTGCFNRAAILGRLSSALADGGFDVAVVFVDLDRFKEVNDREGHTAGDAHLQRASRALDDAVRPTDVVGRFGGDEFLVVCQDVRDADAAARLGERLAQSLTDASVRASIGVAWAPSGTVDADTLVHRADEAMYASKREGAGRPHVWTA